jgi:hypothetical protein
VSWLKGLTQSFALLTASEEWTHNLSQFVIKSSSVNIAFLQARCSHEGVYDVESTAW